MFELSVAAFSSELAAGQDGLEARETMRVKVALRSVKHMQAVVRPTEVS